MIWHRLTIKRGSPDPSPEGVLYDPRQRVFIPLFIALIAVAFVFIAAVVFPIGQVVNFIPFFLRNDQAGEKLSVRLLPRMKMPITC
jgi:hypothetical protein